MLLSTTEDQEPSGAGPRPTRLQPKCRWLRQGEPCPGGRGPRQARHGWRAPDSGQDVLWREKRPPAVRARRPTGARRVGLVHPHAQRSEEHTSELQSLMRISYAVFCLTKKNNNTTVG